MAGLSPELQTLEQLRNIKRPTQIPDAGLTCDLLWSDPDPDAKGWGESDRGVSFTFGADVVAKFLQRTDLDLVCRAHQVRTIPAPSPESHEELVIKSVLVGRIGAQQNSAAHVYVKRMYAVNVSYCICQKTQYFGPT